MKSANLRSLRLVLLAATAGLIACKKPMTYVHVKILPAAAGEPAAISDVQLDLDLAGKKTTVHLTDGAAPIQFPTDVTLEVKTGSGQLALVVICKNASGAEVDRATGTIQVNSGAIAEVALQLPGGKPNLQDAEGQSRDYNSVTAGQVSSAVKLTFLNIGFVPSGPATAALGGVGAAQFAIVTDDCTGVKVAPGATCAVSVVFQPVISGPIAATLTVSATPGGSAVVALTGMGQPNPQTVDVDLTGTGQGSLTSNPAGLSCNAVKCTGSFDYGTAVTLTPAPATGSHFVSWSGACSGTGTCVATLTQARQATAKFDLDQELLTVVVSGNGSVASTDTLISCAGTGAGCSSSYAYGSTVTLTASNGLGSHFTSWSDPTCGTVSPCTLTLTAAATVTANFSLNLKNIVVTVSGNGNGSVSSAETTPAISCTFTASTQGGNCNVQAAYGSTFTVNAAADSVSFFGGGTISGATYTCSATTNSCTVTVADTDIGIAINFTRNAQQYDVTIAGNGSGVVADAANGFSCSSGTPCSPSDFVPYGSSVTFTATPAAGSSVTWSGNCVPSGNTCTSSGPVTAPGAVTATFTKLFQVVVAGGGNGSGTVTSNVGGINCTLTAGVASGTCSANVVSGSNLTLSAVLKTGTASMVWSGGCTPSGLSCTLTNITATPPTSTATFTLQQFNVAIGSTAGASAGSGTITGGSLNCVITNGVTSGTCTTPVNYGSSIVLTEAPSTGSAFVSWTGGCSGSGSTCTIPNITSTPANTIATFSKTFVVAVSGAGSTAGAGSGTVTLFGQTCTITNGVASGTCTATVNYGGGITFTESPTGTDAFVSWSGGCAGNTGSCTISNITATPSTTVATFIKTFTVAASTAGNGVGNIGSTPAGINCGNGGTACTATFNYGTTVTLSPAAGANNVSSGWAGICTQSGGKCTFVLTANAAATGFFNPTSSFCSSAAPAQIFTGGVMHGCAGSSTYPTRLSRCAPGCRVASADEYVAFRNLVTPTHNYWTDDNLKFGSAQGACGPAGCGPNSCFATNGSTYSIACSSSSPMHVCATTQPDPETNTCTWTGCGYNSTAPNTGFGGCSGTNDAFAGSVCICGVQSWFVDQANGSDANEGTSAAPFATIRQALGVAASGQVVHVKPGSYGPAESFPLAIPAGVSLVGDEAGRGTATTILGTVLPGAGATIAGFTIKSTGDGVDANVDRITIRNNTVTGSAFSIRGASTNLSVLLNLVTNNSNQILFAPGSAASGKLENNTITHNAYGIEFDAAGPDLGGGGSSVGNNIFSCNSNADVWVIGGLAISAANNRWDHGPPTNNGSTYVNTGIDLFSNVPANVTSANSGASQAPNACACAPTTSTSTQYFDGAMAGCGGPGVPASIAYASRSSLCPLGTHACSATEWNLHHGTTAPTTNYWTGDNPLFYVSGSTGNCSVSTTGTNNVCTILGGGTSDGAMLVCPNGGLCQQTACGLNTVTPQFFGGCSTSSGPVNFGFAQGTLCCNP